MSIIPQKQRIAGALQQHILIVIFHADATVVAAVPVEVITGPVASSATPTTVTTIPTVIKETNRIHPNPRRQVHLPLAGEPHITNSSRRHRQVKRVETPLHHHQLVVVLLLVLVVARIEGLYGLQGGLARQPPRGLPGESHEVFAGDINIEAVLKVPGGLSAAEIDVLGGVRGADHGFGDGVEGGGGSGVAGDLAGVLLGALGRKGGDGGAERRRGSAP